MKIHQLLVLIVTSLIFVLAGFLVLSSNYFRVDAIQAIYNVPAQDSLATIFHPSGKVEVHQQNWLETICRTTGWFCGDSTSITDSEYAIEEFVKLKEYSNYDPKLLNPHSEKVNKKTSIIYVAKEGSDTSSGKIDDPFGTIEKALDFATPGTTILVSAGDYTNEEYIEISKKASLEKPIRLLAQSTDDVLLPPVLVTDSHYIEISGFRIEGGEKLPEGWIDMPGRFVDNLAVQIDPSEDYETVRKAKIEKKFKTWNSLLNWEKTEGVSAGIRISNSAYITLSDNQISLAAYGIELQNDSRRIFIVDNYLHHNLVGITGSFSGDYVYSFSESLIQNNLIEQSFRTGIAVHFGAHHNIIDSNTIRYSGQSLVNTWRASGYNMFIFNTAEYGGYYTAAMQHPGSSALSLHSCQKGCIAFGNQLSHQYDETGADGNGIIVDFTGQGAYVGANIIFQVQGSGITSVNSGSSIIVNNTVIEPGFEAVKQNNAVGLRLVDPQRDINNIVANNLFHVAKEAGVYTTSQFDHQKYFGHNLYSLAGEIPVAIINSKEGYEKINSISELQSRNVGTGSLKEEAQFIETDENKFKLAQYSAGYEGANEQLMPSFDLSGIPWKANTIGAL